MLSRRRFIQASGGLLTLPSFLDARALADASTLREPQSPAGARASCRADFVSANKFYFAIIADTHIIDEFYNHDYAAPNVSREATHELFRRKLGLAPYYSIEHRGWKFVHLNNFLGDTWNAGHQKFNKQQGSRPSSSSTSPSASSPPRSGPITACCRCSRSTRTRCSA